MARTKKKDLEINKESLSKSMQEAYLEATELRKLALENYNYINKSIEDKQDLGNLTPAANDSLKVAEKALAKKIQVIKVQADTYIKSSDKSQEENSGMNLDDIDEIHENLKDNKEYD